MARKNLEHQELYASLGEFMVSFTEVEHWLSCLLKILCDGDENIWVTLFFIDDLLTGRTRERIEFAARLRLEGNKSLLKDLLATFSAIVTVTKRRNELVHGQWKIDPTGRCPTKLWNFRLKKVKTGKDRHHWEHLQDTVVTSGEIKRLTQQSKELAATLESLSEATKKHLEDEAKQREELVGAAFSGMAGA